MQSASRNAVKPFVGVVTEGSPARESVVATPAGRIGAQTICRGAPRFWRLGCPKIKSGGTLMKAPPKRGFC